MIEPSSHEACGSVGWWRVGGIEILGGFIEQVLLVDRAGGIEVEEVWTVDTHIDWVTLDALDHDFGNTDTLVGVFW